MAVPATCVNSSVHATVKINYSGIIASLWLAIVIINNISISIYNSY